ncbi:MAG TPA: CAP domain-containing protein [Candidatus Saccharimonadales bacterium]
MAIATKPKPKGTQHKKRTAAHHRQTKHYVKSYWPYLPMVAVLAIGLAVNSALGRSVTVLGEQTNLTQLALLDATNEDRQDNQRSLLALSRQLQDAAQAKANDMVAENYWSHTSPNGEKPWKFITATGFQYQTAGENLAYGFDSADSITNAWMHSPEHRANMLDQTYTNVGFGVAQSGNYLGKGPETIVVAMYASPAGGEVAPASTTLPTETEMVSRLESIAAPAVSGMLIGIVGTLAVVTVLIRHSIAWRKLLNRGELFVLHHPLIDTVLVGIAVTAIILSTTTGFIH